MTAQRENREGGPVYWSQPNQQVVRDGEPVGIMDSGPDPEQAAEGRKAKAKGKGDEPEQLELDLDDERKGSSRK